MTKVLLSLCGLTPQVITETLYGLAVQGSPAWIPDEVHVVTTESGRLLVEEKLLHPTQGRFQSLCSEYGLSQPRFDSQTIHVVTDEKEPVFDIRSEADNSRLGNTIMHIVRSLCEPKENLVHASLAGGRKTMSFYLGMAMQLFAKDGDELSHVLVRPPFENHPDFYYPPKVPRDYTVFDPASGHPYTVNSRQAHIELALIPFVRLRGFVEHDNEMMSFAGHISSVQKTLQETCSKPELTFNPNTLELWLNSRCVTLTPTEGALYMLLTQAKVDCDRESCTDCTECYVDPHNLDSEFVDDFLRSRWGQWSERADKIRERWKHPIEIKTRFLQHRSRINRKIRPIDPMGCALIVSAGGYGEKRYGISGDKKFINCI